MTRTWFAANWMNAGVVAGLFLLAIVPVVAADMSLALLAVYLQLPVYMLHQLEEHSGDRFRRYVNETMVGGTEALTTPAVLVINIGGVWGIDLAALYLARFVSLGLGLIAVYLTLVNALVHIVGGVVQRRYNPGLVTAIVLFLPVGLWALVTVSDAPGVGGIDHLVGGLAAVLVHVAIAVHVKRRARKLLSA
ncbi:HXXEE domain-containing protein [Amorphus coralli]|uniref:HXXEE domain-containing protein n=1 Tax=Amorphus coralli TaxID=340680 RepID=UPI000417D3E7|nr:HXXEE domain-containing protein [Amorphus coralli]